MSDNIKSMNFAITVDDGSRRVPIQNMQGEEIGAFTFRPTDIGIVERFNAMVQGVYTIYPSLELQNGD